MQAHAETIGRGRLPTPGVLPALVDRGWRIEDVAAREGGTWVTRGAGAAVDYPASGHALLAAVEDASAWYAARNALIVDALSVGGLPPELVEVGAGNGVVTAALRAAGVDAVAVEPGRTGAQAAARRGVPVVCGFLEDLRLPTASVAAVGMFDVLEHLEDVRPVLSEVARVLEPGGRLAVTVPAMPSLWSSADVLAGHHRRYRRPDLIAELAAAGFAPVTCRYAFGLLVPPVWLVRSLPERLGRKVPHEAEQAEVGTRQVAGYGGRRNAAARTALALERRVRRRLDIPLGTSLVAVFRRTSAASR